MKKQRTSLFRKRQSQKKMGLPPGKLVYIGDEKQAPVKITVFDYDASNVDEKTFLKVEECFQYKETLTNTWINLDGIHDTVMIEKIGKHFGINPLVLEDIVNTNSRAKIDDFKEYVFII